MGLHFSLEEQERSRTMIRPLSNCSIPTRLSLIIISFLRFFFHKLGNIQTKFEKYATGKQPKFRGNFKISSKQKSFLVVNRTITKNKNIGPRHFLALLLHCTEFEPTVSMPYMKNHFEICVKIKLFKLSIYVWPVA